VKNLNGSEAIPKYMFLVSYPGKKDAFVCVRLFKILFFYRIEIAQSNSAVKLYIKISIIKLFF
jgi:hypothetical protein